MKTIYKHGFLELKFESYLNGMAGKYYIGNWNVSGFLHGPSRSWGIKDICHLHNSVEVAENEAKRIAFLMFARITGIDPETGKAYE